MTLAGLVWANLCRNKKRTVLTIASVVVAFFLFGTLRSVITTLDAAAEVGSESRLIISNASGITFLLPEAHANRPGAVPGVKSVSWANWFGGYYQNPQDFFAQFAIKAETYLPMYPELEDHGRVREELHAGAHRRRGRRGPAQEVRLAARPDASRSRGRSSPGDWPVHDPGGLHPEDAGVRRRDDVLPLRVPLREGRRAGRPGWFVLELDRPDRAAEIAASIDAQFKNSTAPTKTETERAFYAGFVTMWGNIGFLVRAIGTAVFFAILFVAANTMMMAVRERIGEIAVLKTLGFENGTVFGLVLAESVLITLLGGALGLLLARVAFMGRNPLKRLLPRLRRHQRHHRARARHWRWLLGLVSGAIPAIQSARLSVVERPPARGVEGDCP